MLINAQDGEAIPPELKAIVRPPRRAVPPQTRYDEAYAALYAAVWTYGHETLHWGGMQPLYQAVFGLAAEVLGRVAASTVASPAPVVVDAGCGIGRSAGECARFARDAVVVGVDLSKPMLTLARDIHSDTGATLSVPHLGFPPLTIAGRPANNLHLVLGDAEDLPVASAVAHLALSINVVDRVPRGPELALPECHRVLRPGGHLIFSDPLGWEQEWLWKRYPSTQALLQFITEVGFDIASWFEIEHREMLDIRGSYQTHTTLVVDAVKKPA